MMTLKNAVLDYLAAVGETAQDERRLVKYRNLVAGKLILDSDGEKVRQMLVVLLHHMPELKIPQQVEKIAPVASCAMGLQKNLAPSKKRK